MRNKYTIHGADIVVEITGRYGTPMLTTISAEDFGSVHDLSGSLRGLWDAHAKRHYVVFTPGGRGSSAKRPKLVRLHRWLMAAPDGICVDHADNDPLNNRRSNLRLATVAQNSRNRHSLPFNTSGFRGVTWHAASQKWQAQIGRRRDADSPIAYLGLFATPQEAAQAFDDAAVIRYGEFAMLNFPGLNDGIAT